jgi:hypothetical protein
LFDKKNVWAEGSVDEDDGEDIAMDGDAGAEDSVDDNTDDADEDAAAFA